MNTLTSAIRNSDRFPTLSGSTNETVNQCGFPSLVTRKRGMAKERPAADGGIFAAVRSFRLPYRVANRLVAMLATIFAVAILSTGCATFRNPDSKAALLADLRDVAHLGASIDLIDNPHHRVAFGLTIAELDALGTMPTVTPANLHQALLLLPISELKGEKAMIYVTGANIIVRRILGGREVVVPEDVRAVALALRDGLKAALAEK